MGGLTMRLARLFAVAIFLGTIALVGLGAYEGEAGASTAGTGPSAVAQLTFALLAAGPEGTYNDTVARIYAGADNPIVQKAMVNGAKAHCGAKLVAEDFSCVPASYYKH